MQVLDGTRGAAHYHSFPASELDAADDCSRVRVGKSRFGSSGLALDDGSQRVRGAVHFGPLAPWPVTWRSPGIMGW